MVQFEKKHGKTYTIVSCLKWNATNEDFIDEILSLGNGEYRVLCNNNEINFDGIWLVSDERTEYIKKINNI